MLLGEDPGAIRHVHIPATPPAPAQIPGWDGHAGPRAAAAIAAYLGTGLGELREAASGR